MQASTKFSDQQQFADEFSELLILLMLWQHRPVYEGSWARIAARRKIVHKILSESPDLWTHLERPQWVQAVWIDAVGHAARHTGRSDLPDTCPWDIRTQVLGERWIPEWAGSPPTPSP